MNHVSYDSSHPNHPYIPTEKIINWDLPITLFMKTLLLLSLSILTTLTLHAQWPNGVTYEIFVQSFYDTDGDSIGDFNGITEKLDYLADLGIEAIWLMPISPSPSYHKYDVTDYRDVRPDYGTMSDFKRMVEQAHRRNIKVVMDLVINHSSSEHPWFIESRKGPDNPYREYYVWIFLWGNA